jgi:electron transfer flavoprotein alpha subunit
MSILVLAHVESGGRLSSAALGALSAARELTAAQATTLAVGLVGPDAEAAAQPLAGCGATRILCVAGEGFAQPRYATDASAGEALCRAAGADVVIAAGTSRWLRVLAGLAQRLGGRADSHVTRIDTAGGPLSVTRWFYRQRLEGTASRPERPWLIAIEPGAFAPRSPTTPAAAPVVVERIDVPATGIRTEVIGPRAPASGTQTVRPDAELLLVAGAGWTKKQSDGQVHAAEAGELILSFLERSQASLGGSKSLVDQSGEGQTVLPFMTHLNQVGQTGSSPRHRKGLATCCHGEEPHVVGWRFITERRAVNLNPSCGWAQGKADVLYVADAFEVMHRINELLSND